MITPLKKTETIENPTPLPPGWCRFRETQPVDGLQTSSHIVCSGPGGQLRSGLLQTIEAAKEAVLVAAFLLADEALKDALLSAVARGVRVYALNSSEQRLSRAIEADGEFDQRMIDAHKALLDQLAGKVLVRSADHLHAKFLVTDPRTNPRGWISTANFNRALLDGVELGVRLSPEEAQELAAWFNHAFWCEAERELVVKGRLSAVGKPPSQPVTPKGDLVPATAKDHRTLREAAMAIICSAQERLLVSSYTCEAGHPVVKALADAAKRGVRVTLLTRPRPANGEAVKALAAAGVDIRAHEKLHAKAIWADGHALVMTANLAAEGLERGFEVGVRLSGPRSETVRKTLESWAGRFPWEYRPGPNLKDQFSEFCPLDAPPTKGALAVQDEIVEQLPPITARDALNLEDAPVPDLKQAAARSRQQFCRRIRFEWEVRPPQLPVDAKERKRELIRTEPDKDGKPVERKEKVSYEPPVYEAGKQVFVLLRKAEERGTAAALAKELGARVVVKGGKA